MGKEKISKTEKKPMKDVSEESTARSLTSDLAKSGMDCKVADQKNLQNRHLKVSPMYAEDKLEKRLYILEAH